MALLNEKFEQGNRLSEKRKKKKKECIPGPWERFPPTGVLACVHIHILHILCCVCVCLSVFFFFFFFTLMNRLCINRLYSHFIQISTSVSHGGNIVLRLLNSPVGITIYFLFNFKNNLLLLKIIPDLEPLLHCPLKYRFSFSFSVCRY